MGENPLKREKEKAKGTQCGQEVRRRRLKMQVSKRRPEDQRASSQSEEEAKL